MYKELGEEMGRGVYGEGRGYKWGGNGEKQRRKGWGRWQDGDGEEKDRRLAGLAELFGDDFTPSINQLSPLLSLLPLPVAWHGSKGVVALSHAL